MAKFDPNDKAHQAFRALAETLVGIDLDPAIDVREVIDVTEVEKRKAS